MFPPGVNLPDSIAEDDLWFAFRGDTVLVVTAHGDAHMPSRGELGGHEPLMHGAHHLGTFDGCNCFAAEWEPERPAPEGMEWVSLRGVFGRAGETMFALAGRAFQVLEWDRTHRFCGHCGAPTRPREQERARVCPECGLTGYPRISPAVMGLVQRGDELLLARSPHFPEGMYSALAGFVEPGESLEQALAREVREEVGLSIANFRYFGSQSWPFPHSLMIAFMADYVEGEITPQPGEIEAAAWFPIGRLPRLPQPLSIARRLIDHVGTAIAGAGAAAYR